MSQTTNHNLRVYPDLAALSGAVAEEAARLAAAAVEERSRFDVLLSGGHTPLRLYEIWAEEYQRRIPWGKVNLFWGDERYVPADDRDSNYRMVREALLDRVGLTPANIHPMATNLSRPMDAAHAYENVLREHFAPGGPEFDLVLLGLGSEGHTASLFPGSPALKEQVRWVVAVHAPVQPSLRLSVTLPVLNRARNVFFLVAGSDKQEIVRKILLQPDADLSSLPAAQVRPAGQLVWFLDQAAAGEAARATTGSAGRENK